MPVQFGHRISVPGVDQSAHVLDQSPPAEYSELPVGVYHFRLGERLTLLCIGVFCAAIALMLLWIGVKVSANLIFFKAWACFMFVVLFALGALMAATALYARITLWNDRVEIRHAFWRAALERADIKGYVKVSTRYGSKKKFVSKSGAAGVILFPVANDYVWDAWFSGIPNLIDS